MNSQDTKNHYEIGMKHHDPDPSGRLASEYPLCEHCENEYVKDSFCDPISGEFLCDDCRVLCHDCWDFDAQGEIDAGDNSTVIDGLCVKCRERADKTRGFGKMKPETLKALKASIAEYEKKLAAFEGAIEITGIHNTAVKLDNGNQIDFFYNVNPLCRMFNCGGCIGCPIAIKKDKHCGLLCFSSPIETIRELWDCIRNKQIISILIFKGAVLDGLDFLKTLLPENDEK